MDPTPFVPPDEEELLNDAGVLFAYEAHRRGLCTYAEAVAAIHEARLNRRLAEQWREYLDARPVLVRAVAAAATRRAMQLACDGELFTLGEGGPIIAAPRIRAAAADGAVPAPGRNTRTSAGG